MIEPDMIMRNIVWSVIRAAYCSEFSDKHNQWVFQKS